LSLYADTLFEYSYSPAEIDSMRKNHEPPPPMPPSITDIVGSIHLYEEFKNDKVDIRQRVYNATGVWEYTVDINNPAVKVLQRLLGEMRVKVFGTLSPADIKIIKNLGLEKVHPLKQIGILKENPISSQLGHKLEERTENFVKNLSDKDEEMLEKFVSIESLSISIAYSQKMGKTPDEVTDLIEQYKKVLSDVGVTIYFTPRENLKSKGDR
jgi:hypothetical protein